MTEYSNLARCFWRSLASGTVVVAVLAAAMLMTGTDGAIFLWLSLWVILILAFWISEAKRLPSTNIQLTTWQAPVRTPFH